ncbi:MAG: hypothetical protein ACP6IP_02260 [Candidatus Njordarchaeia archaeon]
MIIFVALAELDLVLFATLIVVSIFLIYDRHSIRRVSWSLILLFILIFIDINIITAFPPISLVLERSIPTTSKGVMLVSILFSQLISNVPATILIARYSNDWLAIAYGVNIGGSGFVLGSLANIIALTLAEDKKAWVKFHKYSVPYLIITTAMFYVLFPILPFE